MKSEAARSTSPGACVIRTLVVLVEDRPGALNRTVSLLRGRGFTVPSIAVGESERAGVKRMTVVVNADDADHAMKQLNRLIEVLEVRDVTFVPVVERETALVKIHAPDPRRREVETLAEKFGARVVGSCDDSVIVEMTDTPGRLSALIESARSFGVRETMRSGRLAMEIGTPVPAHAVAPDEAVAADKRGPWWAQADGAT